jgi:hypothetical protein
MSSLRHTGPAIVDRRKHIALGEETLATAKVTVHSLSGEDTGPARLRPEGGDSSIGTSTAALETGQSVSHPAARTPKRASSAPAPPTELSGRGMCIPARIQTSPSVPLAYRFPFPEAPGNRVRAEMLRADREFVHDELLRDLTSTERQALAVRWICRIVGVFAHEACDLVRSGTAGWTLSLTERRVNEVLSLLALQAEHSKFVDGSKPGLTHGGQAREEVRAEIARSSEWSEYRDTVLDLLNQHVDSHPDIAKGPAEEIGKGIRGSAESEPTGGISSITERATTPARELIFATTDQGADRSKMVDAFLLQCNAESAAGFRVIGSTSGLPRDTGGHGSFSTGKREVTRRRTKINARFAEY